MSSITRALPPELAPYAQDLEEFERKTSIRLSFPPLGIGGGGIVLKAQQGDRPLAVKVIAAEDAAMKEQALREARILKQVQQAKAIGGGEGLLWQKRCTHADLYFLGMDFIPGQTLTELIAEQGALAESVAIELGIGIAEELEALHTKHIIHRDVKPDNVIMLKIGQHFQPIVVDYGIAKVGNRTERGAKAATDGYAPPEQYQGGTDRRTDVYALGATLYEMVTGQTPPTSITRDPHDVLDPRDYNPMLSSELTLTIQIATAYHPRQRFANIGVMKEALQRAKDGDETAFWSALHTLGVVSAEDVPMLGLSALSLDDDDLPRLAPLPPRQPTLSAPAQPATAAADGLTCPVCEETCPASEVFCTSCGAALYLGVSAPVAVTPVSEEVVASTHVRRTPGPQLLSLLFARKIVLGGPELSRSSKWLLLLGYWFLLIGIALGARSLSMVSGLASGVTIGCSVFLVVLFPLFGQMLYRWGETTITRRGQMHWLPRGLAVLLGLGGLVVALSWLVSGVVVWQSAWFLNPPPLSMLVYGAMVFCGALLIKALLA